MFIELKVIKVLKLIKEVVFLRDRFSEIKERLLIIIMF